MTDHIHFKPPATYYCERCGFRYSINLPATLSISRAISSAITIDHRDCAVSDRGIVCHICLAFGHDPSNCPTLTYNGDHHAWWNGPDSGLSSKTICATLLGWKGMDGRQWDYVPLDQGDFGRCVRFLRSFPDLRQRLPEMAKVTGWEKLVENWDRLEALYDSDDTEGKVILTHRIQSLR